MIFNFFKKNKEVKLGLEKALNLELITKKECLELKFNRAKNDLEKYTEVKVKVKKVR